ncbi:MAG: TonB-dependent receptor [candidate division Zixibacteria bacterium]|nr:TonB-dependent receptor [candidate division Zixibacteria bacterium]
MTLKSVMTPVAAVLWATIVCAAPITRVVVDPERHPLVGVSVVTSVPGIGTQTDTSGQFELETNPDIKWVTFSSVGYRARQFSVTTIPDTVVLEPIAARGEDVIITADRAKAGVSPLAYENFSRDKIERDYKIGEFPTLLESTPNLYAHTDAGGGLGYSYMSIRGFDDKRVSTYINGVPLNDPEDQATYFVDLPDFAATITDIQIQRGVGNSLYGDASFGGSVNIVTQALSRERRTLLSTGYGNYPVNGKWAGNLSKQTISYSSGLVDGRWEYAGRFSRQSSGGYRYNSWYDGWSYYLSAARLDPKMSTELHVYGGPMRMHLAYLGATLDDIKADRRANQLTYSNETDNFNQPHYQLHNIWNVNDRATLSNTLYYIRGKGYYEQLKSKTSYADYNIDTMYVDDSVPGVKYASGDIVRQQWVYKNQIGWNPRLDVEHKRGTHSLGGSFYYFDSDHWGQAVWGEHLTGGLDPRNRYYEYFGKKYVGSVYAQEIYKWSPKVSMQTTAQIRYQRYRFNQTRMGAFKGYNYDLDWLFFSPRVGINWAVTDKAGLFANIAVSSRTPTDADIYDAGDPGAFPSLEVLDSTTSAGGTIYKFGDPTAKSERVYDFELGGTYKEKQWQGNLNLYWMEFRNEIIPYGGVNENTGIPFTVNADRSVHAGIELSTAVNPAPHVSVSANGAINYLRIKKYTASLPLIDGTWNEIGRIDEDMSGKTLAGFPIQLGNILVDCNHTRWRAVYRLRLVGKQFMELRNLDSLAIKGYAVSSISGEYRIPKFLNLGLLTLSVRVENLFNRKFVTSGYGWNDFYQASPSGPIGYDNGAEYFVNAERSFYAELKLEMF